MSGESRRETLAAVRERNQEWAAETPGGPQLSSAERGRLVFEIGCDRRFLLGVVDELVAALERSLTAGNVRPFAGYARDAARVLLADLGPDE